jgi:hypothetical protein
VLVSGIQDKNAQLLVLAINQVWQVKRSVLLVLDKSEKGQMQK